MHFIYGLLLFSLTFIVICFLFLYRFIILIKKENKKEKEFLNKYKDPDNIDEIAGIFLFLEDRIFEAAEKALYPDGNHPMGIDLEDIREYDSLEDAIDMLKVAYEEPWNGITHMGDCTRSGCTCALCVLEEYREQAREKIRKYMRALSHD